MAHIHSIYDSDLHFKIDPVTRGFSNEGSLKTQVVQNDHNSERFTFELPRYIEGHDMLLSNSVQVHYLNVGKSNSEQTAGIYNVDDLQESPEDENVAVLSWLVSNNATKYVGSLNFVIRFACMTGETIDYAWNTTIYDKIHVTSGIYNSNEIAEEYADILEQWKAEIDETLSGFTAENTTYTLSNSEDGTKIILTGSDGSETSADVMTTVDWEDIENVPEDLITEEKLTGKGYQTEEDVQTMIDNSITIVLNTEV